MQRKVASRTTVLGLAALPPNPARFARAVELRAPGDFFSSLLTLCYCVLHQSDVFCSSALQVYCAVQFSLCRSQWNGCAKASGRVLVLQYCLAILLLCFAGHCWRMIALELLHHRCGLNVRICTKHCIFSVNGGSVAEKSWLACTTVLGVAALPPNPARFARAVELRAPGDFFSFVLTLCYCVLHQSDVFCSSALQVYCAVQFSLCRLQWNGCAKASGRVLVLQYCLAILLLCFAGHCWQMIALELLHHRCGLNVRICRKHCVFSGKRMFRCREKLARARDGLRPRRFAAESGSICARSGTEGSRWLFLFFVDAVLMCCDTLCIGNGASKR